MYLYNELMFVNNWKSYKQLNSLNSLRFSPYFTTWTHIKTFLPDMLNGQHFHVMTYMVYLTYNAIY